MLSKQIIGKRVYQLRKRAGYNQKAFAKLIGVNRFTLSGIESGKHHLKAEQLFIICEKLSVSPNEFLEDRKFIDAKDTCAFILKPIAKEMQSTIDMLSKLKKILTNIKEPNDE